uniref:Peptidase S74 domain-containing protein n=1 Tax=viral metagenome TaxID=1070528 RepID=A0A6M3LVY1_9ZZZZ
MHTVGDDVKNHALSKPSSTRQCMDLLGLPKDSMEYQAGNLYWAALNIIAELQKKIEILEAV